MTPKPSLIHSSHWGAFRARVSAGKLEIEPIEGDPEPSPIIQNLSTALTHPARLTRPLVRRGWLENGPGPDPRRGSDDYVEMGWDEVLGLVAKELARLGAGPDLAAPYPGEKVFGGSYGWSSAGRFHHAQSQVHRFLNSVFGGYVRSVETYSSGAGAVILDTVLGNALRMSRTQCYWDEIETHSDMVLAFGGLALRNLQVSPGGISRHDTAGRMAKAASRGCRFVSISPVADDIHDLPNLERYQPRPATDVALMLGMGYRLVETGSVDRAYLARYTSGYDAFEAYLTGASDGVAKSPEWASSICGLPADLIAGLADRAAGGRTHISVAYALQRASQGEQPVWMGVTLAAMLGQFGQPGGGFSYSLGSIGSTGKQPLAVPLPLLPQGENKVGAFIPVARISDLLLNPGGRFPYRGSEHGYPDIRLVYWAGGNPFHHHQDLSRLTEAFSRPDTIIVHDSVGTATTRHADIVLPTTLSVEREDIGAGGNDLRMLPMQKLAEPAGEARDDYTIFAELARRLGCEGAYTEGRTARQWLEHLYQRTTSSLRERQLPAPDFEAFMDGTILDLPGSDEPSFVEQFHADPEAHPLPTPSGRIEISSAKVASSGLPAHPAWIEPAEWLGSAEAAAHPFQLVANQPRGKLHSQLDFGPTSMAEKSQGRVVARLNPDDARRLGLADGDVILVNNDRGAFLAAVRADPGLRRQVIQVATGSWYAPVDFPGIGTVCVNGNPNTVTLDQGASVFSQGCAGQLCLVAISRWDGPVPPVVPHADILPRPQASRPDEAGPS